MTGGELKNFAMDTHTNSIIEVLDPVQGKWRPVTPGQIRAVLYSTPTAIEGTKDDAP